MGVGYKKRGRQDTDEPAILFFVEKKVPVEALAVDERVPKRIGRSCTDVIEVGEIRFLGRTEKLRPALPDPVSAIIKLLPEPLGLWYGTGDWAVTDPFQ